MSASQTIFELIFCRLCAKIAIRGDIVSHSKFRKKGQSLYIEKWNPAAKKYINICYLCGRKGYSPAIEDKKFLSSPEHKVIYEELVRMFDSSLTLDSFGRCDECAKRQDDSEICGIVKIKE